MVSSNHVYIGFGSKGDFSLSWYDGGSFFASLFTGLGLASSCFLEGISGELLVLHNLRSYVRIISRGDGGRKNFNTWKKVDGSAKDRFEGCQDGRVTRSGIDSCLNMRKVASPFGSFRVNIVAKALGDGSDSSFSLAIGLVMVSGSHVEINFDIGHKLSPEGGGEPGVSVRDDRSGETVDREDSFNEDFGSFDCCDVLRNWDEVGETSEAI